MGRGGPGDPRHPETAGAGWRRESATCRAPRAGALAATASAARPAAGNPRLLPLLRRLLPCWRESPLTSAPSTRRATCRPRAAAPRRVRVLPVLAAGFPARPDVSRARRRGLPAPQLRASPAPSPRREPLAPALEGVPGAGAETAEGAGPARGARGRPLRARSVREPAESGHPGRDNSGSSGRERRSHLPETRRTARRREARPAPARTSSRPAARSSPQRRVGGDREGGAGPGTPTALHLPLPPPASLAPSLPPSPRGRGRERRAGVRLCSGARPPAPRLPAPGEVSADGRYFSLQGPLCSVSDECQVIVLKMNSRMDPRTFPRPHLYYDCDARRSPYLEGGGGGAVTARCAQPRWFFCSSKWVVPPEPRRIAILSGGGGASNPTMVGKNPTSFIQ